jgi:hypothetical protein
MLRLVWPLILAIVAVVSEVRAEAIQWVNTPRMCFGDAVPQAVGPLASLDLGASPPPGSSRLFSRDELRTYAIQAHEEVGNVDIPLSVRVKRTTHRFTALELETLVRPALVARLPEGATLIGMTLPNGYVSVPNLQVSSVQMPRLPKRVGITRATPVIELIAGGALIARLPVAVEVQLDERAIHYALERGATLNLIIDSGSSRVSATAALMTPADVGDIVACQVVKTRKVLRARVLSVKEASVVQQ